MRLLPYLAILIVAIASMALGAGLMTLAQKPVAQVATAPNRLAQREADRRAEKTEGDAERPLTPLYPASPGGGKDVRVVYPPSNQTVPAAKETTGAAPAVAPQTESKIESKSESKTGVTTGSTTADNDAPQQAQPLQPARAEQPAKNSLPTAVPAANHCDIQACAGAYASFRASDCTYQPFQGPRRACVAPPAAQQRTATSRPLREADPRPQRAAQDYGRDDVELRTLTRQREVRSGYDDDEDDDEDTPPRPPALECDSARRPAVALMCTRAGSAQ